MGIKQATCQLNATRISLASFSFIIDNFVEQHFHRKNS